MDREMDGRTDRIGCEIGEERCDVCAGQRTAGRKRRIVNHNQGSRRKRVRENNINEEEDYSGMETRYKESAGGSRISMNNLIESGVYEEAIETAINANDRNMESINTNQNDQGEDTELREDFMQEKGQYEINRRREIEGRITEGRYVQELRERFQEWKEGCVICKA